LTHDYLGLNPNKEEAEGMALSMLDVLHQGGEAKGKSEAVLAVLESRFGQIPKNLHAILMSIKDIDRLNKLIKLAAPPRTLPNSRKGYQPDLGLNTVEPPPDKACRIPGGPVEADNSYLLEALTLFVEASMRIVLCFLKATFLGKDWGVLEGSDGEQVRLGSKKGWLPTEWQPKPCPARLKVSSLALSTAAVLAHKRIVAPLKAGRLRQL
jgi:hypothetical protein